MAGRKLKVFQAQFGSYDTVVAAPSQAAALRAWGVNQNLSASGEATLANDEAAIAAATRHPETPLRRAVGSSEPFEPTSLPKSEPAVTAKRPADGSNLDTAEQALTALDDGRRREEADFRRQAEDLEARRMAAQDAYVDARRAATAKVVSARIAYRNAGGAD